MHSSITAAADLAGARVLVAGARVTGISAARVLREWGAEVTVTDASPAQLEALAVHLAGAGLAMMACGWPPRCLPHLRALIWW